MKVAATATSISGLNSATATFTMPENREITVQDLLTHVSGLGSGGPSAEEMRKVGRKLGEALKDFIPRFGSTPLDFQPG